jgi:hypothetical protein
MIYLEASLRVVPGKMSLNAKDVGKCWQKTDFETEPHRNRTCNLLIKRHDLSILLDTSDGYPVSSSQNPSLDDYPINHLILYGIAKFVGKMLVKILLFLESIQKRKS